MDIQGQIDKLLVLKASELRDIALGLGLAKSGVKGAVARRIVKHKNPDAEIPPLPPKQKRAPKDTTQKACKLCRKVAKLGVGRCRWHAEQERYRRPHRSRGGRQIQWWEC